MISPGYGPSNKVAKGSESPAEEAAEKASDSNPKNEGKKNYRISARQISNGWLCEESWNDHKGEYKSVETYHAENPLK